MESSIVTNQHTLLTNHQSTITNIFLEKLEIILEYISILVKLINNYNSNIEHKNFDLEIELDCLKLNLKYSEAILGCFCQYKLNYVENHKIKMLRLYDFTVHEFKRLRHKYEELESFYFSIDEENNYITNIKNIIQAQEMKPTPVGCMFLGMFVHYLKKIQQKIDLFSLKKYNSGEKVYESFKSSNIKIQLMCKIIYSYLVGGHDYIITTVNYTQSNELLKLSMSDINNINSYNSKKWAFFHKNLIHIVNLKLKMDKFGTKKLINKLKNEFKSFITNLTIDKDTQHFLKLLIPDIKILKLIFDALENKLLRIYHKVESLKINEVLFFSVKNFENFKLMSEIEGTKRFQTGGSKNLVKIRILTNQQIKINYNFQNLYDQPIAMSKMSEINFFGLLLKLSKDFLTPNLNVIIHISGGGFFSQSSESHMNYLTKWTKETDCVLFSFDYKLSQDNKYPILLDECVRTYETIVKYSEKLFNFNINKLVLYSDSVGSILALDIIKYSIKNHIKIPDSAIFLYPCSYVENDLEYSKDGKDAMTYTTIVDSSFDTPSHSKLQEMFWNYHNIDEDFCICKTEERLNFFLTDSNIVQFFPSSLIIASINDPIRDYSYKLAEFLNLHKVQITFKQIVYYCNGFLQVPSLFEESYTATLEYTLNYIKGIFKSTVNVEQKTISDEVIYSASDSTI